MLSIEEATKFLEERLGVVPRKNFSGSPPTVDEVQHIVKQFQKKIPFQNITLLAQAKGSQDVPSLDEIKQDMLQGFGGLCYSNNVFMANLLASLGCSVHHLAGTCNPKHPNNHILTLIENLTTPDSKHLVDVGCGYPTYQIIPVDFQEESAAYTSAFLQYKFRREDSKFIRLHQQDFRKGIPGEHNVRQPWERFYDFDLNPRDLGHFQEAMSEVYQDRFLKKLRFLIFEDDAMIIVKEDGDQAVLMKLTKDKTDIADLTTDEDVIETIDVLAPTLDRGTIKTAVENWHSFKSKPTSG